MIIDTLDDLVSGDKERMMSAFADVAMHIDSLTELDAYERHSFDNLGRQLHAYDEWPDSEQHRFRRMAQGVRHALIKRGVFDKNGFPIWPR